MGFLVRRELEIREFVPIPYWKVTGVFEKEGEKVKAEHAPVRLETRGEAQGARADCLGNEGQVSSVSKRTVELGPPVPFNIGDLQKEAFRAFRFNPSKTMQIAERLYLAALISYPRTGSQRLPTSINYRGILQGVGKIPGYTALASELLKGEPKPVQGPKTDPAHPAIHPTGVQPRRSLDQAERSVFDLVVRRFLAAFGPTARRELSDATLKVGEHEFRLSGGRTLFPGWIKHYGKYAWYRDVELPGLSEGDTVRVVDILVEEKFEQRPPRYNQGSLLEKMEQEGIGTKATRADIIATLVARGYVAGESMEVTDLGLAVVLAMDRYVPSIVGVALTKDIEEKLEAIEGNSQGEAPLLRDTVRSIAAQLELLGENEEALGKDIDSALLATMAKSFVLGKCPVCKTGDLRVIRSKATKKRFVGCSNYKAGCAASAPLPQRGTVKPTPKPCEHCSWPVVYIVGGGRPWRLCVNPACPGKSKP